MRGRTRTAGWVLFGAVAAVLLIAWTNIANLWLARAASRARETAIRAALGAGKARLIMHHVAELAWLSAAGWLGGLSVAWALLATFRKTAPPGIIGMRSAALDPRLWVFTGAILLLSVAAFALLPAGDVRVAGARRMGLRNTLVIAQVAISVFLVSAAGLLIHTWREFERYPIGRADRRHRNCIGGARPAELPHHRGPLRVRAASPKQPTPPAGSLGGRGRGRITAADGRNRDHVRLHLGGWQASLAGAGRKREPASRHAGLLPRPPASNSCAAALSPRT